MIESMPERLVIQFFDAHEESPLSNLCKILDLQNEGQDGQCREEAYARKYKL